MNRLAAWSTHFALLLAATFLCPTVVQADLVAGDIAIVGINTDNPDSFTWLPLVNLPAGEEIFFTDSGVLSSGSFRGNEGAVKYTAPLGGITAGTLLSFAGVGGDWSAANDSNVGTNSFNLSGAGDQVIAFSGTSASPTFIFAAQTNSTQFQTTSNSSNDSSLPDGLDVGETAVAVGAGSGSGSEFDNSVYNFSVTSGTRSELLAAIANQDNWNGSNSRIADLTGGNTALTVEAVAVPEPSAFLFGSLICGVLGWKNGRKRNR